MKKHKNQTNIHQKSAQTRSKIGPKSVPEPTSLQSPFLDRFWIDFGLNLGPSWEAKSGHVGAMLAKKLIFETSRQHCKTDLIFNTFEDPLETDFGSILHSKITPSSEQNRSQEQW